MYQISMFFPILGASGFAPFIQAYFDADLIGRILYIALILLSFVSWTVLIYKWWITQRVEAESMEFKKIFLTQKHHPLEISFQKKGHGEIPNAFFIIYTVLKNKAVEFMKKNEQTSHNSLFSMSSNPEEESKSGYLQVDDFSILEAQANSMIGTLTRYLERNLYILSTIVTLAPFLGLLGTVYGILVTFAGLESGAGSTQQILSGLSLALTTTVIGLVNAIPALIGYSMIKNKISDFEHEMERFAMEILSTFDSHYRIRDGK